jgi:hypothetical protein
VRLERIVPGRPPSPDLDGAVLTRDLIVDGARWAKGRRLSGADLATLGRAALRVEGGPRALASSGIAVLAMDPTDLHEDEAAERLAAAVGGPGLVTRGPAESRVDLVAAHDGVVHVRTALVERIDRIDPLELFTLFDGQVVATGEIVASVKVAPHVVPAATIERAERVAARAGRGQGVAPRARARAVRGERPAQGRGARVAPRLGRLRRGRPGRRDRRPQAPCPRTGTRSGGPRPDRRLGQHRPVRSVLRGH